MPSNLTFYCFYRLVSLPTASIVSYHRSIVLDQMAHHQLSNTNHNVWTQPRIAPTPPVSNKHQSNTPYLNLNDRQSPLPKQPLLLTLKSTGGPRGTVDQIKGRSSLCCVGQWKRVPWLFEGWKRCLECSVMSRLAEDESRWVGLRDIEACSLVLSP